MKMIPARHTFRFAAGLALMVLIHATLLPAEALAQPQAVGVIVMPFEIHAPAELAYLKSELPEAMRQQFTEEGANARVLDDATAESWNQSAVTHADLARLAVQTGADYLVWGSLTWIGQDFSLDVRLLASAGDRPAKVFTAVGKGVENLPGAVKKLVQDMGLTIFKREKVVEVVVEGNQRIETDAIRRLIKTKPGDVYLAQNLAEDLKAIYGMGYFDDIEIESQQRPDGVVLVFKVTEKPTVRAVSVSGNVVFDSDEIKKSLNLKKGSILNIFTVRNDMRRIEEMYKEKNYHNVKVTYTIAAQKNNQADVEYAIDEGQKLQIKKILFTGNTAFSASKLKGVIDTSEKGIFSWFTSAGDLNQDILNQDAAKLQGFYQNNGYIRARVGEPQLDTEADGIVATFKINEGPRFKVGKVDFSGDLILPKEQLLQKIKIDKEPFFNREVLRNDVLALTDLYANDGHAYVDVSPLVDQNAETLLANITFKIDKGKQVYFEQIQITGNTKTRDKVIRRELRIYEQELYGGQRLKSGIRNLNRLDYFKDVKMDTAKGSADDQMKATVAVTEKSTGAFTVGAGYSTAENAFVTGSVSERNLFGRGQTLALRGMLGGKTQRYSTSFTEPYLFDIPLSAGVELYKWQTDLDDYSRDSIGGTIRFGYPLAEYVRGNVSYNLDFTRLGQIDDEASQQIKDEKGDYIKSSITLSPRYDSRDSLFNAKEGAMHSISYEFAGLGGDVGFNKVIVENGWYFPLLWKLTGVVHDRAGYVRELPGWELPDYEKFYLGGINSMRGFSRNDLAPQKEGGAVGGNWFLQGNFEVKFPLVEEAGVFGMIFLDTGMVGLEGETPRFGDLRYSAGPEIRWLSPIGPIRIAYGFILNPQSGDSSNGAWEFSVASSF
jgi:outer membrane protein insertion porin family